jgi:hypothetical protein
MSIWSDEARPGGGFSRLLSIAAALAVVVVGCAPLALSSESGERARVIPAPSVDESAGPRPPRWRCSRADVSGACRPSIST